MQSTSLPPLLDELTDDERAALLGQRHLRSLADVLASVPDPRAGEGSATTSPSS